MPAQSQQQQKLFGLALAFKRGEVPASEVSDEIKDIADRMSEKEIEDFAATKHKGLPKMKEQLRKIVREIMREKVISEMTEGKKRFRQQDGIGKAKYTISYHDGKQKHKDGSDFFGIQIFKNKKDLETFRNTLLKKGYIEESVNEMQVVNKKTGKDITRHVLDLLKGKIDKKKFEKLTGLKKESVNEAVSKTLKYRSRIGGDIFIEIEEDPAGIFVDVRMKGRTYNALLSTTDIEYPSGHINVTPRVKNIPIKESVGESVNEGYSTEEKRIVMMAVRKLAKYRNVPLDYAINDLLGAGKELERDIKKGKITK